MEAYDDDSEDQDIASRPPVEDTPEDDVDALNLIIPSSRQRKRKKRGHKLQNAVGA